MLETPKSDAHLYIHHCCHAGCTKWGGFGMDRFETRQKVTYWWCWEHYPYKAPPSSPARRGP